MLRANTGACTVSLVQTVAEHATSQYVSGWSEAHRSLHPTDPYEARDAEKFGSVGRLDPYSDARVLNNLVWRLQRSDMSEYACVSRLQTPLCVLCV